MATPVVGRQTAGAGMRSHSFQREASGARSRQNLQAVAESLLKAEGELAYDGNFKVPVSGGAPLSGVSPQEPHLCFQQEEGQGPL